jgi:hypothetical protein
LNGNACEKLKKMEDETKSLNRLYIEKDQVDIGDDISLRICNWLSPKTYKQDKNMFKFLSFQGSAKCNLSVLSLFS